MHLFHSHFKVLYFNLILTHQAHFPLFFLDPFLYAVCYRKAFLLAVLSSRKSKPLKNANKATFFIKFGCIRSVCIL